MRFPPLFQAGVLALLLGACGRQAFHSEGGLGTPGSSGTPTPSPGSTPFFAFRRAITVSSSLTAGESLSDFPLLVATTDSQIGSASLANGADLVFTAADGITRLPSEIERWNKATGALTAWVRLPALSKTTTNLFLYYGNPSALPEGSAAAVWSGDFLGVWHLADDPAAGVIHDSLGANDGVPSGLTSASQVPGAVGGSLSFSGSGAASVVIDSTQHDFDFDGAQSFTYECWIYSAGGQTTGLDIPLSKGGSSGADSGFDIELPSTWEVDLTAEGSQDDPSFGAAVAGQWVQLAAVVDRTAGEVHLYQNGTEILPVTVPPAGSMANGTEPLTLGGQAGSPGSNPFQGGIDEVRISSVARTAGWIHAEAALVSGQQGLVQVGPEEANPTAQP